MSGLEILSLAPGATIQDQGRLGFLRFGVTGSGALDGFALAEGQALLRNEPGDAALEFAQSGGRFRAVSRIWVATSGAEMALRLNGEAVSWRQSLLLLAGDVLEIAAAREGVYGYLHVPGGFQTDIVLGSRSTHLRAGFGHVPAPGQTLIAGDPARELAPQGLQRPEYFDQRVLRLMWGPQSHYFSKAERERFLAAEFEVGRMRDRMGMQIIPDSGPLHALEGLTIASDAINPGDIQVTGDGTPTVLLADRGSSGGYPRIGVLATADIPAMVQLRTGTRFRFEVVERAEAVEALAELQRKMNGLTRKMVATIRDPRDIGDLLAYNLIDGVLRGDEDDND